MAKYITNSDKILQAVLQDERLAEYGNFNPDNYETIEDALQSENTVVCAVAKIIDGKSERKTDKELYNEINNYLKENI
jgi:hypothetical protein